MFTRICRAGPILSRWLLRPRVLLGASLLLTVFGAGWWTAQFSRNQSSNPSDFPYLVRIVHSKDGKPSYGGVDVRDRQIINFLDTLFPGYRDEVQARPPASPDREHYVLEFTLQKVGYAKRLVVWSEGDTEYWSGGRDRLRVQGSFRRLVEWLPMRRAIELATQPQTRDNVGRKILTAQRDELFRVVIDNAQYQVEHLRFWAIRDLLTLTALESPRTQHRSGGHPIYHGIDGYNCGPFPANHPWISNVREVALQSLQGTSLRDASTILAYTADENTIDELTRRLKSSGQTSGDLIICLQACLGLPEFQKGGMCGNSSRAEFQRFFEQQEQRTDEAKGELLTWLAEWKGLSEHQRSAAVVAAWQTELLRPPGDHEKRYFRDQSERFGNLLRRGRAMLPAVEVAQGQSSDLTLRGGLEFCKAFWTGQCDADLVTELLSGNYHQQIIACDVITAALDPSWKDGLAKLLRTQRPSSGNPRPWVNAVDKAVEALVMCHDVEALPLLKEIQPMGFDGVRYAVQHFEVPEGSW